MTVEMMFVAGIVAHAVAGTTIGRRDGNAGEDGVGLGWMKLIRASRRVDAIIAADADIGQMDMSIDLFNKN